MVGHQGPGKTGGGCLGQDIFQAVEEIGLVLFVLKDVPALDPAHNDVVQGAGRIYACFAGHVSSIPQVR